MIIKCIKCKKEFKQKRFERQCGCRSNSKELYKHEHFENYKKNVVRFFQNPIYQHYRLHHDEDLHSMRFDKEKYEPE